ncbi:MAG: MBL fold metallo-hydrolase [Pseudomonadota bacterium]
MAGRQLPEGMHVFERGWLSANNILFTGAQKSVLIDSGYCTHSAQTVALVGSVLGERPLDILINTHLHSDHCGGNAALQSRYPTLETFIPPGQSKYVADWDPVALTYEPTGQLCPKFSFTQTLQPGLEMDFGHTKWQIHAAPGHDPHSLVFFEPAQRLLISADALWESGFGVVFPELEGEKAFEEVGATLDLIEQLDPSVIIPGHGAIFKYSPATLDIARHRLDAFVQDPLKHANHAAKVLLKFKLLETQRQTDDEFADWAKATPYLAQIRERFFRDTPMDAWVEKLCDDLCKSGAAMREGSFILNS